MAVIKGVLREELKSSLIMKSRYEKELAKLPLGSLIKKRIRGNNYYYRVARINGKPEFHYLGKKVSEIEIERYQHAREYRAKYRHFLSQVKKQIAYLRSALRGKEEV